jgi:hypothetical protein
MSHYEHYEHNNGPMTERFSISIHVHNVYNGY